jgi:ketol-acid reductoisomerase
MHQFISDTAKYGDLTQGPRVINAEVKQRMKDILTDIQTGVFAKDWVLENQANCPKYKALLEKDLNHPIEKVGREVRANMSWIAEKK